MVIHYEEALYQVYAPLPLPLVVLQTSKGNWHDSDVAATAVVIASSITHNYPASVETTQFNSHQKLDASWKVCKKTFWGLFG